MKKKIFVVVLILFLVIAAVAGATIYNKNHKEEPVSTQKQSYKGKLPQVTVYYKKDAVGKLLGYVSEQQIATNRNDIIPVSPERVVPISVKPKKNEITKVSYEIKSMEDDRLLDSGAIEKIIAKKGVISFDYTVSTILQMGEEYSFCLILETKEFDKIYYYSRMMVVDEDFISAQMKFAKEFSDKTYNSVSSKDLIAFIEPDLNLANDSLGQTTIQSSFAMLTWNSLTPKKVGDTSISAKEFCIKDTGEAGTYTMNYQIKSVNAQKVEEMYNVAETITVWTCAGKQYVLAYDREVNQIWTADENNIGNSFIDLGIQNTDKIEHVESPNRNYLSFAINGDAYVMNVTTKEVVPIYKLNAENASELYQTRVKVLNVTDEGNANFIIYGYSPSEEHVGKNGISIMHFDKKTNETKEKVFMVCGVSAAIMEQELQELFHIGDGTVYLKLGKNIYYANTQTKETGILVDNLEDHSFAINRDGSMLVYNTSGKAYSDSITIVDLNNGQMNTIEAGEGKVIKVCGYTGENLVYGLANKTDAEKGYKYFPMNIVKIVDPRFNEIKSYYQENVFVTDVEITDTIINMKRVKKGKAIDDDQLLFNSEEQVTAAYPSYWTDDVKMKEIAISFVQHLDANSELNVKNDAIVLFDTGVEVETSMEYDLNNKSYVYGYGKLQSVFDSQGMAEKAARAVYGLVTNEKGQKTWVFEEHYE